MSDASPSRRMSARTALVYAFLRAWWAAYDYAPSYRDIVAGCGLSSTSVAHHHVLALERHGLLRRSGVRLRPRAIVPLDAIGHPAIGRPDYEPIARIGEHGDGTPIIAWRAVRARP